MKTLAEPAANGPTLSIGTTNWLSSSKFNARVLQANGIAGGVEEKGFHAATDRVNLLDEMKLLEDSIRKDAGCWSRQESRSRNLLTSDGKARPLGYARNSLSTSPNINFDLRILRIIPLGQGHLDVVAESFNLLNHSNVSLLNTAFGSDLQPSTTFSNPIAASSARRIQFSLDYEF